MSSKLRIVIYNAIGLITKSKMGSILSFKMDVKYFKCKPMLRRKCKLALCFKTKNPARSEVLM